MGMSHAQRIKKVQASIHNAEGGNAAVIDELVVAVASFAKVAELELQLEKGRKGAYDICMNAARLLVGCPAEYDENFQYADGIAEIWVQSCKAVETAIRDNVEGFAKMLKAKEADKPGEDGKPVYLIPQSFMTAKSTIKKALTYNVALFAEGDDGQLNPEQPQSYRAVLEEASDAKKQQERDASPKKQAQHNCSRILSQIRDDLRYMSEADIGLFELVLQETRTKQVEAMKATKEAAEADAKAAAARAELEAAAADAGLNDLADAAEEDAAEEETQAAEG